MNFFPPPISKTFPSTNAGWWCHLCKAAYGKSEACQTMETPVFLSTRWKYFLLQTLAFSSVETLRWEKRTERTWMRNKSKGRRIKKKSRTVFFYLSWRIVLDHVRTQRGERRRTVNKTSTPRAVGPAQTSVHSTLFSQGGDLWCISSSSHPLDTFITK